MPTTQWAIGVVWWGCLKSQLQVRLGIPRRNQNTWAGNEVYNGRLGWLSTQGVTWRGEPLPAYTQSILDVTRRFFPRRHRLLPQPLAHNRSLAGLVCSEKAGNKKCHRSHRPGNASHWSHTVRDGTMPSLPISLCLSGQHQATLSWIWGKGCHHHTQQGLACSEVASTHTQEGASISLTHNRLIKGQMPIVTPHWEGNIMGEGHSTSTHCRSVPLFLLSCPTE